jgi:hypothetical protein
MCGTEVQRSCLEIDISMSKCMAVRLAVDILLDRRLPDRSRFDRRSGSTGCFTAACFFFGFGLTAIFSCSLHERAVVTDLLQLRVTQGILHPSSVRAPATVSMLGAHALLQFRTGCSSEHGAPLEQAHMRRFDKYDTHLTTASSCAATSTPSACKRARFRAILQCRVMQLPGL